MLCIVAASSVSRRIQVAAPLLLVVVGRNHVLTLGLWFSRVLPDLSFAAA
ncbi:MAG TPA: hypothetical protein VGM39_19100 [Kofleriaceae bacterium]